MDENNLEDSFWKTIAPLKSREFTLITNKIVSFLNFSSVVWKENIQCVFIEKPPFSNFLQRCVMSPDYCKSVSIYATCRGEKNLSRGQRLSQITISPQANVTAT